jgi:hypothetical protein
MSCTRVAVWYPFDTSCTQLVFSDCGSFGSLTKPLATKSCIHPEFSDCFFLLKDSIFRLGNAPRHVHVSRDAPPSAGHVASNFTTGAPQETESEKAFTFQSTPLLLPCSSSWATSKKEEFAPTTTGSRHERGRSVHCSASARLIDGHTRQWNGRFTISRARRRNARSAGSALRLATVVSTTCARHRQFFLRIVIRTQAGSLGLNTRSRNLPQVRLEDHQSICPFSCAHQDDEIVVSLVVRTIEIHESQS